MQAAVDSVAHVAQLLQITVHTLLTSRKQRITLLHFKYPGVQTTLLWSHANAMDIGEMYFFLLQLALNLRVNIAAYDYSGYGASTGRPSEAGIYSDIQAVYEHLVDSGVNAASDLVLYGQSVGSAATLWLGSRVQVRGIVLHTPLTSGLRVLVPAADGCCSIAGCCSPVCVYALCDPFPNMRRIKRVECPVLIIHGTSDTTIDCSHAMSLYHKCPAECQRDPYIIRGATHDNIVEFDPERYFEKMRAFLSSLEDRDARPLAAPNMSAAVQPRTTSTAQPRTTSTTDARPWRPRSPPHGPPPQAFDPVIKPVASRR